MIDRAGSTTLANLLRARAEDIAAAWGHGPPARLGDVGSLVRRLAQRVEPSTDPGPPGTTPPAPSGVTSYVAPDAGQDVADLMAEHARLRRCILEVVDRDATSLAAGEVLVLDEALDEALAEAVVRHTAARHRTLAALDRIAAASLDCRDASGFLAQLLLVLVESAEDVDTAVLLLREGDVLRARAAVGLEEDVANRLTIRIGEGFAGRIAARGEALLLRDARNDPLVESPAIRRRGVRALFGVPLFQDGEVIGVAQIGSIDVDDFAPEDLQLFHTVAERAGALIRQQLARDALQAATRRLALLAEASAVLGASLDEEEILDALPRLVVPYAADWCAIDLVEGEGFRRAVLVHSDPHRVALARRLQEQHGHRFDGRAGPARVIRTGQPELYRRVSESILAELANGPEQLEALRSFRLVSLMVLPLRTRNHTLGALTLATDVSGRTFDPDDVTFARELAARVALAVDNSHLYQAAFRELEARRDAEAQLARAVTARDGLIAAVNHDVRGPLQSILLNADALTRTIPEAEVRMRQRAESIRRATQRVARLTEDLVSLAAIDSGHSSVTLAPEEARAVLEEAVDIALPIAAASGRTLQPEVVGEPGRVLADRDEVARVLHNLLMNAIRAAPSGGTIVARVIRHGPVVRFEVKDSGPGIPPDQLNRVFERGRSCPMGASGAGLGLVIAKAIVEAHHGRIGADSVVGQGSTFWFTLPVA